MYVFQPRHRYVHSLPTHLTLIPGCSALSEDERLNLGAMPRCRAKETLLACLCKVFLTFSFCFGAVSYLPVAILRQPAALRISNQLSETVIQPQSV